MPELIPLSCPACGANLRFKAGDAAIVQVKPTKPMVIENVKELPQLGRFAIRDMGSTIAAGMCIAIQPKQMR